MCLITKQKEPIVLTEDLATFKLVSKNDETKKGIVRAHIKTRFFIF
jgi:hypothetical protein